MPSTSRGEAHGGAPVGAPPALFDGRYIQDRYHGIGRYAFHLLKELAGMLPEQRFVVLRDPGLPDSRFDWGELSGLPNVRVLDVAAAPFSLSEQTRVPLLRDMRRSSVYHTPYFALPWLRLGPSFVTVHDCIFERDARYMPKRWARLYYRLLMFASMMRARTVFVPSRATARDVRKFYRVPARKLVVTPEAADPSFRPVGEPLLGEVRSKYDLPEKFVLAVGARRPHKNFGLLVRAVTQVEGAQLVFAGSADERFFDEATAEAEKSGNRVRFLGSVPEADLPVLYNLATVYGCPSVIEGFGLPVLEAMACGTPVVCSDIPVFREVAGSAALMPAPGDVVAWANALRRLLDDSDLRLSLSRAGLERAASFSWRRAAEAALPAYHALAKSKAHAASRIER